MDGRSFATVLKGGTLPGRDFVIKEHNENAGGSRDPMRAIQTRKYLYLFNAWSNGSRIMATATTGTSTYRRMAELAKTDSRIAARHQLYQHRVVEELYDVETDPDCLVNLIAAADQQAELTKLRTALEKWMVETNDPLLEVFRNRQNAEIREAFVTAQESDAETRKATGKGKKKGARKKKAVEVN
jgi:N-sulfoglucosamine sulfohydrolase